VIGIGVDLGGTKMAVALVTADGVVSHLMVEPTPARSGPARVIADLVALVGRVRARAEQPVGWIGVAAAGAVDPATGTIVGATDAISDWAGTRLAEALRRELLLAESVPVIVNNDVDAHAIGESWMGAARLATSLLMVTVGTGIGGAIVVDGVPRRGAHHRSGDIGHIPVAEAQGVRCSCGRLGHVEGVGSGPGLRRLYLALGGNDRAVDARAVVERARNDDPIAVLAVATSARAVGRAIAGAVATLDPLVVVVGGGLGLSGEPWWSAMEGSLRAELVDGLAGLQVMPSALGDVSGVIGASRAGFLSLGAEVMSR